MCAQNNIYAWREQAIIREIATHDLYCCLLPQCEALRTCRSSFRSEQLAIKETNSSFPLKTGFALLALKTKILYTTEKHAGRFKHNCFHHQ